MTRIMYDSVTPAAIPADAQMVAGYLDGEYAWTPDDWRRFPNAVKITITITATTQGDVLDVETGDATSGQAPGWVKARRMSGYVQPTIYCNRSTVQSVIGACTAEKLTLDVDYWIWLATLDGTTSYPPVPKGIVAYQDKGAAALGFNADSSVVVSDWWHRSPLTDAQRIQQARVLVAELVKVLG